MANLGAVSIGFSTSGLFCDTYYPCRGRYAKTEGMKKRDEFVPICISPTPSEIWVDSPKI
jgi:hypothetical protein